MYGRPFLFVHVTNNESFAVAGLTWKIRSSDSLVHSVDRRPRCTHFVLYRNCFVNAKCGTLSSRVSGIAVDNRVAQRLAGLAGMDRRTIIERPNLESRSLAPEAPPEAKIGRDTAFA